MEPILSFDDVGRSFGGQQVLDGLSFAVAPGEVFALVGRNGCGKTTAIRLGLGLLAPDRGGCRLLGHDSRQLPDALRDRIGYVPDAPGFYPGMRLSEVLDFEAGTRRGFDRSFAERALEPLELPPGRRVRELSRGQRALLALLVAVAQRPSLLVLDEPTAGLDAVVRRQFLDALIDLVAGQGTAVLMATHVLSDVERVAERVGVLHGGRLLIDARLDELRERASQGAASARPTGWAADEAIATRAPAGPATPDLMPAEAGSFSLEDLLVALVGRRGASFPSLSD
jgi:ABC-2 type transport system ATP-binding protein